MNTDQANQLREPFPPEMIGKLPKAGMKLDYVGHAAVTDRLLYVDPEWTWEPVAFDEHGAPLIVFRDKEAELWIRLTVGGVTRIGVGTEANTKANDLAKKLVSDALRNAAMRFGVAIDLWSKEELLTPGAETAEPATASAKKAAPVERPAKKAAAKPASKPEPKPTAKPEKKAAAPANGGPTCAACGYSLGGSSALMKGGKRYHAECAVSETFTDSAGNKPTLDPGRPFDTEDDGRGEMF